MKRLIFILMGIMFLFALKSSAQKRRYYVVKRAVVYHEPYYQGNHLPRGQRYHYNNRYQYPNAGVSWNLSRPLIRSRLDYNPYGNRYLEGYYGHGYVPNPRARYGYYQPYWKRFSY